MTPMDWALLPVKKTFVYSGRAPRAEYWWFYLATVIVGFILDFVDKAAGTEFISPVISLLLFIPTVSVSVRRLHDIDRTGWWLVLLILPLLGAGILAGIFQAGMPDALTGMTGLLIVGAIAFMVAGITLLVFMVTAGTPGPNRYGDDPYGPSNLEEVFA